MPSNPEVRTAVDQAFTRLQAFLDPLSAVDLDLDLNRSAIQAHFAEPARRARHLEAAQRHLPGYTAIVRDVVQTAAALATPRSPVSDALLIDWISAAPDVILARLPALP